MPSDTNPQPSKLRVDKWLWAARFFKTRSLAKSAIEGGKVQIDGQRVKVSKEITVGDRLLIRQGWEEREIDVVALSDQRRGASVAQQLYRETAASLQRRAQAAEARKAAGTMARPDHRPNKHERRQLSRLRRHLEP